MNDFLCIGFKGIAAEICDRDGNPVFSPDQIRRRYGQELKEAGVLFELKIRRGQKERYCCWFSKLKRFFEIRGELA